MHFHKVHMTVWHSCRYAGGQLPCSLSVVPPTHWLSVCKDSRLVATIACCGHCLHVGESMAHVFKCT